MYKNINESKLKRNFPEEGIDTDLCIFIRRINTRIVEL